MAKLTHPGWVTLATEFRLNRTLQVPVIAALILITSLLTGGCSTTHYPELEAVGFEKREILSDRIQDARNAHTAVAEQLEDNLDLYRELSGARAGEDKSIYISLEVAHRNTLLRHAAVERRIEAMQTIAQPAFEEWRAQAAAEDDPQQLAAVGSLRGDYEDVYADMQQAAQAVERLVAKFEAATVEFQDSAKPTAADISIDVQAELVAATERAQPMLSESIAAAEAYLSRIAAPFST